MAEGAEAIFGLAEAGMVHQGWSTRATRLDYVRACAGLTVSAWAEQAQVADSTLSQYRSGTRLLDLDVSDPAHVETVANVLKLVMVARAAGVACELPWVLGGSRPIDGLAEPYAVSTRAAWIQRFIPPGVCSEDMKILRGVRPDGSALAPAQQAAARVASAVSWVSAAWILTGVPTSPPGVQEWRTLLTDGERLEWGWGKPAELLGQKRALQVSSDQCWILSGMIGMHIPCFSGADQACLRSLLRHPGMSQYPLRFRPGAVQRVLLSMTGRQVMLLCDLLTRTNRHFPTREVRKLLVMLQDIAPAPTFRELWCSPCVNQTVADMWNRLERWGTMMPATTSRPPVPR
jgi:hypothetical protein